MSFSKNNPSCPQLNGFMFPTDTETKQIDKIFEDYTMNISLENIDTLSSSEPPNEYELDLLENNLDDMINLLTCSSENPSTEGHEDSSKYMKYTEAENFIAKYS